MLDIEDILATERMFDQNKLDVRTVTMGISLLSCVSDDEKTLCDKIYDTICRKAEHLTEVTHDISREYGVPIINRRISVTPISLVAGGLTTHSYVPIAETLQRAADAVGVDILGGFSALVDRGMSASDKKLIDSIPEALAATKSICSSVAIGSTKAGINMDAVKRMGEVVKETAELTKDQDAYGCTKLVEFCNAVEDNPFMAGAFHGVTQGDTAIHVASLARAREACARGCEGRPLRSRSQNDQEYGIHDHASRSARRRSSDRASPCALRHHRSFTGSDLGCR